MSRPKAYVTSRVGEVEPADASLTKCKRGAPMTATTQCVTLTPTPRRRSDCASPLAPQTHFLFSADNEAPLFSDHGRPSEEDHQGDREAVEGARAGHLGSPTRRQPALFRRHHRWSRPVAIRTYVIAELCATTTDSSRRRVQARAVSSGRLPDDAAQGPLLDQDLPSEHRPLGQDLLGRAEE
jgi:hypothetical protein